MHIQQVSSLLMCSDYGFELNGENCDADSWFNASVPIKTCEVGSKYFNSSGSVSLQCVNVVCFTK